MGNEEEEEVLQKEEDLVKMANELGHKKKALSGFLASCEAKVNSSEMASVLRLDIKCKPQWPSSAQAALQFFDSIAEKIRSVKRDRKNWSKVELGLLFFLVMRVLQREQLGVLELGRGHWEFIGSMFPGRTGEKCMFKWLTFRKFDVASYPWTEEEDRVLEELVRRSPDVNWL
jgi:hypothetical protein